MGQNIPVKGEVHGEIVTIRTCTDEELRFARLVAKHNTIIAAATEMWPHLKKPVVKASHWMKRPAVKAAVRAAEAQTEQDVRAVFEQCGLGILDRILIVADLVKNPCTKPNQRIQLLQYIDELEGRNKKTETQQGNLMAGIIFQVRQALPSPDENRVEDACLVEGPERAN